MSVTPDRILADDVARWRKVVYDYVKAIAMGELPPRRPEEYEWHMVVDGKVASEDLRELCWKQYAHETHGWGSPVTAADVRQLEANLPVQGQSIGSRLHEIACEIEDLEYEIQDLERERDALEAEIDEKGRDDGTEWTLG